MPFDQETHESVQRVIERSFRGGKTAERAAILQQASAAGLPREVEGLFDLLPPGGYTRRRLVDQLNSAIVGRGMGRSLGTFE